MVEAGGVEIFGCIEKHKLLIFRHAKNAEHYKIELNWNVSGTRISAVRSSGKKRDGMLVEVSVTSCIRELNGSKDIVSNSTFPFCKILFTCF